MVKSEPIVKNGDEETKVIERKKEVEMKKEEGATTEEKKNGGIDAEALPAST
jgi:hypothetical protein